jgi:PAS domain-containing protein
MVSATRPMPREPLPLSATAQAAVDSANAARMFDASAQQFSSAFENAPIGMSIIAPNARRLRVNRAFCKMLG